MKKSKWKHMIACFKAAFSGSSSAGFSTTGEMDSGELCLMLDVDGVCGSVYLSKEMWEELGRLGGWSNEK